MRKSIFAPLVALALAVGLAGCVPIANVSQPEAEATKPAPSDSITPRRSPPSRSPR